jgi:tryptophanyl-tRNA synthetase
VLMAADILLYDANIIPVGKDQKQHLEMARDIATRFNQLAGEDLLILPEARIDEKMMTIPGIDGQKMSKSYNNYINIFLPENELKKVVKKIVSDSTPLEEPKDPEADITFKIYSLLGSEAEVDAMRQNYINGGYGYGHAKQALLEIILEKYAEPRRIYNYYMENTEELEEILKAGEVKARAVARQTISKVRRVLGFGE